MSKLWPFLSIFIIIPFGFGLLDKFVFFGDGFGNFYGGYWVGAFVMLIYTEIIVRGERTKVI